MTNVLLMLNAESRNYFQRAILMSGALLRLYPRSNHRCIMSELARSQSKSISNDTELIGFLQQMPAKQLSEFGIVPYSALDFRINLMIWGPIVEGILHTLT